MATLSRKKTNNKQDLAEFVRLQRSLAIKKARRDFWSFCRLMYPEFYTTTKPYLKELCHTLQDFYEDTIQKQVLIINLPPRHGKTFTAKNFILWLYGQDPSLKAISASYNQILSSLFAQQTRDGIMQENENARALYFSDIFPEIKIKQGDAAKGFWSLEGSQEKNYLATSPGGTSTGIGANIIIVDDIIKSAKDAYNRRILKEHWDWYNNTLVQRMERPRKQIIIMTRWSSEDLAGRMQLARPEDIYKIEYKAKQDDGTMLSDEIMTRDEYESVIQEMGPDIASANYQQEPIDQQGRMYEEFKTYSSLPASFDKISSYTDTADKGKDYLASYIYGEKDKQAYILETIYTKEPMEVTEKLLAEKLHAYQVNMAYIESNNGGRGYGRNVKRILYEQFKSTKTVFDMFHQSGNKEARIFSNSAWVQQNIYFPEGWHNRWPELYHDLNTYQKEGKNEYDDAEDALTGIAEKMNSNTGWLI